jgi:D-alanyl-D-alanine carboxypeptidase/D-alanyl-D-alanine-endopeptidase (penicillin-binding protein 4)
VAARAARAAVQPVIDRAAADTCVVVGDGPSQVVAHRDADPLGPASTLKLLTGAATLDLLGGDARLTTRFAAAGAPVDGVVTGDLFMVGGGDPLLSTDAYAARSTNGARPATDLEAVADQLVAAGVRRVTGGVVGDGSRYDAQRALPTWPTRFQAQNVVGPLSALVVNDGWLVDPITPDVGPGGPAPDPALHAAEVMTALLRARGVQVDGAPRSGVAPAGTTTVLEVPSLTVDEIVGELTAFSDNTTAELLVKELDVAAGGAGTTAGGLAQITSWAQQEGLPTGGMVLVDGSGLSEGNRVTCDLLAALLAADGTAGPLSDGLARPGGPGTLEDRMTSGPLRERVRAKTGTLNSVSSLAGWLRTDPGRDVSFVVVSNPQGRTAGAADQRVQEDLLAALLPYPQSPPAEQLAPRPPVAPA